MSATGESSSPTVRACALNLMVVTQSGARLGAVSDVIGEVSLVHPARMFVVVVEDGSPALDAWISARCSIPRPGERQVCCEEVTISAAGESIDRVPSIVVSLLVPDVPTVLLWQGSIERNTGLLNALRDVSDKVVVDSRSGDTARFLHEWHTMVAASGGTIAYSDIAWTLSAQWRSVVANAFQSSETRKYLSMIDRVYLVFNATAGQSGLSQALLLVGWLAARLGWVPGEPLRASADTLQGSFRDRDNAVTITIERAAFGKAGHTQLECMEIHTSGGFSLRVVASGRQDCVEVALQSTDGQVKSTVVALMRFTDTDAIVAELDALPRDSTYEVALTQAVAALGYRR